MKVFVRVRMDKDKEGWRRCPECLQWRPEGNLNKVDGARKYIFCCKFQPERKIMHPNIVHLHDRYFCPGRNCNDYISSLKDVYFCMLHVHLALDPTSFLAQDLEWTEDLILREMDAIIGEVKLEDLHLFLESKYQQGVIAVPQSKIMRPIRCSVLNCFP